MFQPRQNQTFTACCFALAVPLPRGYNETDHWRCHECGALYIMDGGRFSPCMLPEKHSELSHAGALAGVNRAA